MLQHLLTDRWNTPEFAVLSPHHRPDVFRVPCFNVAPKEAVWYCKIKRSGGPDDVYETRKCFAWKHCPKNLHVKSVLWEQLLQISLCTVATSMKVQLSGHADTERGKPKYLDGQKEIIYATEKFSSYHTENTMNIRNKDRLMLW